MRIGLNDLLKNFPKRLEDSHKGTYGKILNIAGSKYFPGAAILSSLSALKVGAGYVTLACPEQIAQSIISYCPDITILPLQSENTGIIDINSVKILSEYITKFDVISVGSGLTTELCTQNFIVDFLGSVQKPVIIDADGLNAIAAQNFNKLPQQTIITPHPMELSRLLNISVKEIQSEREKFAISASKKYNCITVLKGKNTIVTDGFDIYVNTTGNSALAKAGSGDVLTGIISGLYAQSGKLFDSAAFGTYIHGLAADIAISEFTEYGLLASELLRFIPKAIEKIIGFLKA